jgi:hypothetical protein
MTWPLSQRSTLVAWVALGPNVCGNTWKSTSRRQMTLPIVPCESYQYVTLTMPKTGPGVLGAAACILSRREKR